jgi:hypothetical protein
MSDNSNGGSLPKRYEYLDLLDCPSSFSRATAAMDPKALGKLPVRPSAPPLDGYGERNETVGLLKQVAVAAIGKVAAAVTSSEEGGEPTTTTATSGVEGVPAPSVAKRGARTCAGFTWSRAFAVLAVLYLGYSLLFAFSESAHKAGAREGCVQFVETNTTNAPCCEAWQGSICPEIITKNKPDGPGRFIDAEWCQKSFGACVGSAFNYYTSTFVSDFFWPITWLLKHRSDISVDGFTRLLDATGGVLDKVTALLTGSSIMVLIYRFKLMKRALQPLENVAFGGNQQRGQRREQMVAAPGGPTQGTGASVFLGT